MNFAGTLMGHEFVEMKNHNGENEHTTIGLDLELCRPCNHILRALFISNKHRPSKHMPRPDALALFIILNTKFIIFNTKFHFLTDFVLLLYCSAAIEAYRRAVDINPRDYRAWYGLGQMYLIRGTLVHNLYYIILHLIRGTLVHTLYP